MMYTYKGLLMEFYFMHGKRNVVSRVVVGNMFIKRLPCMNYGQEYWRMIGNKRMVFK